MEKLFLIIRDRDKKILGLTTYKKLAKKYFSKYNLYDKFTLIKIQNEFLIEEYLNLYENKELIEYFDDIMTIELYNSLKPYLKEQINNVFITKNTLNLISDKLLIDKENIEVFNKVSKYLNKLIQDKNLSLSKLLSIDEHVNLYLNSDMYYNTIQQNEELDNRYLYLIEKE